MGEAILPFVRNKGRIQLVCSPELSRDDIVAMERGYVDRERRVSQAIESELEDLLTEDSVRAQVELLATLVAVEVLEIRVAFRTVGTGIFHEKIGLFVDRAGDQVSFKGSSNETWFGWHPEGNLESIETFASWREGSDRHRVKKHSDYLQSLWENRVPSVRTVAFPAAARDRLLKVARPSVEDAVPIVRRQPPTSQPALVPLPHQSATVAAWIEAGRRGLVEHATGTGKTVTAIMAIKEHVDGGLPAIVLVPTIALQRQWRGEINRLLPDATVLLAGGGHARWEKGGQVEAFTAPVAAGPRILLATMGTARTERFLSRVVGGQHLLVVADEVHRLGSQDNQRLLSLRAGVRLGLSATPVRYGDPLGTQAIVDYFGPTLKPILTLRDAIEMGRLVPYQYFPRIVRLEEDEVEAWVKLTARIGASLSKRGEGVDARGLSDRARLLLLARARIAKKARGKVAAAAELLAAEVKGDQRWLVYCEDLQQLGLLQSELGSRNVETMTYFAAQDADHAATLRWLASSGGIVLSVRCLDEGVDVPAVSHALIIASSQNPREFVQRRGRVLRRAPGKSMAVVHDLIALPPPDALGGSPAMKALVAAEIGRAVLFGRDALNSAGVADLERELIELGFDPEEVMGLGVEEHDDVEE
jgi:superfamily II DNA or RNA helicase